MRDRLMGMLRAAGREIKRRKEEFTYREQQRIREEMARRELEMTNAALDAGPEQGQAVDGAFRFVDGRRPAPPGGRVGRLRGREDRPALPADRRNRPWSQPRTTCSLRGRLRRHHGGPRRPAEGLRRYPVSDREVARPRPRRPADRLSGRRNLEGAHGASQGKVQCHGTLAPQPGREEDRRGPEAADPDRIRRDAAEGRRRLSQGPAPHRDPARFGRP